MEDNKNEITAQSVKTEFVMGDRVTYKEKEYIVIDVTADNKYLIAMEQDKHTVPGSELKEVK